MELNPKQQEAVNHVNGPLLIVAGAGSGKTKTLTGRLMKLIENGAKPAEIIAITFTNKAAEEMRHRVTVIINYDNDVNNNSHSSTMPFIGTFHSLGARILKKEARLLQHNPYYTIFDADDSLSLIKKILKNLDLSKEKFNPLAIQNKISRIKSELLEPTDFDESTEVIYKEYEAELVRNNAFDFDDLIEKVVRLFIAHPEILKKYQIAFKYVLVDEYQDINAAQYQLIKLLAREHQNLSVVGDDAQAIYSFRGADFRNFLNFEKDWPNAKVVKLEQNYRSSATIIAAASSLIKNNKFQKPKDLWTSNKSGDLIKIIATHDPDEEALWISDTIKSFTNYSGTRASLRKSINDTTTATILYRTNAQSRALEQALIQNQIFYKIFGGLKFYERKEVKDVVAGLRLIANPKDTLSVERLDKALTKGISKQLIEHLTAGTDADKPVLELINGFISDSHYFEYLDQKFKNSNERIENVNELIIFASQFKTLTEFLERVALLQSADAPSKSVVNGHIQNPINLMTIHLAKGLEFDSVFVAGCNDGILPHQRSFRSPAEFEEERRLMYVAMTRAKKNLFLSFYDIPSRFLYELPPELTEFINLKGGSANLPDDEEIYIEE